MRAFAGPCLAVIFLVNGVADIVAFVLDPPVIPNVPADVGGGHFTGLADGNYQSVLLADPLSGYLEHIAADKGSLAGMREIDTFRAGNPACSYSA